jgi:hypothetical protein
LTDEAAALRRRVDLNDLVVFRKRSARRFFASHRRR